MSWAYMYTFSQFVMVVILTLYYRHALNQGEDLVGPLDVDETAAQYDDWQIWEKVEEIETAEEHRT
jgi:hypothetical protein